MSFAVCEHGTWRFIQLQEGPDGKALTGAEIVEREVDMDRLKKLLEDFNAGVLPGPRSDEAAASEQKETLDRDFGWVAPDGTFTESPWGQHEESAEVICHDRGWDEEYRAWRRFEDDMILHRDYLIYARRYCLIHNPSLDGGYIVTHEAPLTKKQRDFLYGYFMDKGDRFKAEQYLQEE